MSESMSLNDHRFGVSAFTLKIIAIIFMTIDHATYFWYNDIGEPLAVILRSSGRLTFPIMVFLIAEGYFHTRNKFKYAGRLFVFAIISMGPFYLMENKPWNVLFTLFVGLSLLIIKDECSSFFDKIDANIWTGLFGVIAFVLSLGLYTFDWGFAGIFAVYVSGQIKNTKIRALVIPIILFCGYLIKDFMIVGSFPPVFDLGPIDSYDLLFYTGALFSSIPLLLYNGEKGFSREPYTKYLFYVYYPLHIFIIYMIWSMG